MASTEVQSIFALLPTILRSDDILTRYLNSLFPITDPEDGLDALEHFVRPLLESEHVDNKKIADLITRLTPSPSTDAPSSSTRGQPTRLDHAITIRNTAQSQLLKPLNTDPRSTIDSTAKARTTTVDLRKLAAQERKTKDKFEQRSKTANRFVEYEGSRLVKAEEEAKRRQAEYERIFMEVNPLNAGGGGKSLDVHLENIDVSFGSLRILSGAELSLAAGRRYGLVGRNGVGKSTLLRSIALREVPVDRAVTVLLVEQEVLGDDTTVLQAVLSADVWRHRLLAEEAELNATLTRLEAEDGEAQGEDDARTRNRNREKDKATNRLAKVQESLIEMDAETGPSRASELLAGLGFSQDDQHRPTRTFSGGWRMRISLARALFVKPQLLMLDEPSNNLDLNALAWLESYLQTWPNTLLIVSHDRAFLDAVATDIIHQHSERLDYYKGNFTQFYATRSERNKNQKKEYENQMQYREHLQAFIDRWRYNANRAAQAQSKIKILEKLPKIEPPEEDDVVTFRFVDTDKISPPLLQLTDVTFGYTPESTILQKINFDVSADSRIGIVGPNGAGKSTLLKILIGELEPQQGQMSRNGRLRIAYFAQHHIDQLDLTLSPAAWLAHKFPGKSEQEYRQNLGAFGITGMTGLQTMATLSGGQKSRVAFATLSLSRPHVLILDEPTNHLDLEGLDALMKALNDWNGGVILISHDERFINTVCDQLWVCADHKVEKFHGDVSAYKKLIVGQFVAGMKLKTATAA